jgi:hypothetical protein
MHAAAGAGDRVDLLDEADGAALFGRGLAQLLEVVADLATGRAVVLRLEAVDDTNRNGTPASCAIALAMYVFPVPGGPSNNTPLRGLPPITLRKVW